MVLLLSGDSTTVSLDAASYSYTGSEIKPAVTVTDNGVTFLNSTDYSVSYSNNVNVGTATVTVTGINGYTETVSKEFTIGSCDIVSSSNISIALEYSSISYSGTANTPSVTI
ncbi:MAG: hypothetical protein LUG95_05855 [Clostridiales bacterium]|nr:hypothetical protein [Clostridiales bacterium]